MRNDNDSSRRPLVIGLVAIVIFSVAILAVFVNLLSSPDSAPSDSTALWGSATPVVDPREVEGYADVMAWRLCSQTLAGANIESQLVLVVSLDKELYQEPLALRVANVASRLEQNLTVQEIGDIAMELTAICSEWRQADAEKFR